MYRNCHKGCFQMINTVYKIQKVEQLTGQYLYNLNHNSKQISFWHDVPLKCNNNYQIGIEIPQNRIAKYELSKSINYNSIIQDSKRNRVTQIKEARFYAQFPCFNYGFFPQTWESSLKTFHQGYKGDDDPLDAVELGITQFEIGQIVSVRVLGAFCLLDQGEIDWKILVMNEKEANEHSIQTFSDLQKLQPWRQNQILDWFRYIKTFDGKSKNEILFDGNVVDANEACKVISETHQLWRDLHNKSIAELDGKRLEFNIQ